MENNVSHPRAKARRPLKESGPSNLQFCDFVVTLAAAHSGTLLPTLRPSEEL
jgi:hypothetical protein